MDDPACTSGNVARTCLKDRLVRPWKSLTKLLARGYPIESAESLVMPVRPLADPEIRTALRTRLLSTHGHDADTIMVEELGLCQGQVRVDLAVVNGSIHGFEIKSDRDSLRRLANQIETYGKVLDRATLVVGSRHLEEALEQIPNWWGVVQVEATGKGPRFKSLRRGRKNPAQDPRMLVELLWREEALELLEHRGAGRGLRSKPRNLAWDRVVELFDLKEIGEVVREKLKARARNQDSALSE